MDYSTEFQLINSEGQIYVGQFPGTTTLATVLAEFEKNPQRYRQSSANSDEEREAKSSEVHMLSYTGVPPTQDMAQGAIQLHITIKGHMQSSLEVIPDTVELTPHPMSVLGDAPTSPYLLIENDEALHRMTLAQTLNRIGGGSETNPCLRVRQYFRYIRPKMSEEEANAALAAMKQKLGIATSYDSRASGQGGGSNMLVGQGGIKSLLRRAGLGGKTESAASTTKLASSSVNTTHRIDAPVIAPSRDEKLSVTITETPTEREKRLNQAVVASSSTAAAASSGNHSSNLQNEGETEEFFETTAQDWMVLQEDLKATANRTAQFTPHPSVAKDYVRVRIQVPSPFLHVTQVDEFHSVTVEKAQHADEPVIAAGAASGGLDIQIMHDTEIDVTAETTEMTANGSSLDTDSVETQKGPRVYTSKGRSMLDRRDLASETSTPGKISTYEPAHPPLTVEACFHVREPLSSLYSFIENLFASTIRTALEHGEHVEDERFPAKGSIFEEYPFYIFAAPPHRRLDEAKGKGGSSSGSSSAHSASGDSAEVNRIQSVSDKATLYDVGVTRPMRLFVTWLKKPLEMEWSNTSQYQRLISCLRGDLRKSANLSVKFA